MREIRNADRERERQTDIGHAEVRSTITNSETKCILCKPNKQVVLYYGPNCTINACARLIVNGGAKADTWRERQKCRVLNGRPL